MTPTQQKPEAALTRLGLPIHDPQEGRTMNATVPEKTVQAETTTALQYRAARLLVDFLDPEADRPSAIWMTPDYLPGHLVAQVNRPAGDDRDTLVRAAVSEWAEVFGSPVTETPSGGGVQTRTRIDGVDVRIWAALDNNAAKDAA